MGDDDKAEFMMKAFVVFWDALWEKVGQLSRGQALKPGKCRLYSDRVPIRISNLSSLW